MLLTIEEYEQCKQASPRPGLGRWPRWSTLNRVPPLSAAPLLTHSLQTFMHVYDKDCELLPCAPSCPLAPPAP